MKKFRRTVSVLAASCLFLSCVALAGCGDSSDGPQGDAPSEEELTAVREELQNPDHMGGLGELTKMEHYENGVRIAGDELVEAKDNKMIYYTADEKRVVNFSDGYIIDLGLDWVPDFSLSPVRTRYTTDQAVLTITTETNSYDWTMDEFIEGNFTKFITSSKFRKANNIEQTKEPYTKTVGEYTATFYNMELKDCPADVMSHYTYAFITQGESKDFWFFTLKYQDGAQVDLEPIVDSFQKIRVRGVGVYSKTFELKVPDFWSDETKEYYERLRNQDHIDWGFFGNQLEKVGMKYELPIIEQRLNYKFPVISQYVHYATSEFPVKLGEMVKEEGRQLQLTYQYTTSNNTELDGYTPTLDIYRGKCDDTLREFARQIKEYGDPVLFRLNNEMNTDWTSYCGMVNMIDPDIFIETWVRLYKIFEEEGVDNCIWIFNPFDGSYPPCNWANFINYMPDSEYVQMIGLTGYESGKQSFRSFRTIYDEIEKNYEPFFMDWPWIISEFGCGSGDGTKLEEQATWVKEMFDCFEEGRYSNIKVAVWFSGNDYNADGTISNYYAIDKDNKLFMKAFKQGLERTQ